MKKTTLVLSAIIASLMVTAYGTCYLQQVVCCVQNGQSLGTTLCGGGTTETVYANEDAWRFDTYATSVGGFSSSGVTTQSVYCDGASAYGDGNSQAYLAPLAGNSFLGPAGPGFEAYYANCLNGGMPSYLNSKTYGWGVQTHVIAGSLTPCN